MRIALAIVAVFFARFITAAWFYPGHDGDLSWQQWLGAGVMQAHRLPGALGAETFTSSGAQWVPQEWAFSLAVAATLPRGHFAILAAACAIVAALAVWLTAWRAYRRGASPFAIAVTISFAGFALLQSFGVRAQVFGWAALAIVLLLLDTEGDAVYLAIPVVALWANLHASALVAPVLVAAWSAGVLIEDRAWTPRVERAAVAAVGCFVAVFLTPLLWRMPVYAVALEASSIRQAITEWQPSDLGYAAFSFGVLPLIALCVYFGIAAPRERWRDGMQFACMTALAFLAIRHVPLAALTIAPMAAQRLTSLFPSHARVNVVLRERFSEAMVFSAAAFAVVAIVVNLTRAPAIAGVTLPQAAMTSIARAPGEHRLYCEDFAWCSLALLHPNVKTFIDGRCDPFPPAVWADYLAVERVTPRWSNVLDRYGADVVLAAHGHALAQALSSENRWRLFYRDSRYDVFVRSAVRTAQR